MSRTFFIFFLDYQGFSLTLYSNYIKKFLKSQQWNNALILGFLRMKFCSNCLLTKSAEVWYNGISGLAGGVRPADFSVLKRKSVKRKNKIRISGFYKLVYIKIKYTIQMNARRKQEVCIALPKNGSHSS